MRGTRKKSGSSEPLTRYRPTGGRFRCYILPPSGVNCPCEFGRSRLSRAELRGYTRSRCSVGLVSLLVSGAQLHAVTAGSCATPRASIACWCNSLLHLGVPAPPNGFRGYRFTSAIPTR